MAAHRTVHYEAMEVQIISDDEDGMNLEKNYVEVEKTFDYIHGNMTFEEYSAILEQGIKEEPLDEGEELLGDTPQMSDASSSGVLQRPEAERSTSTLQSTGRKVRSRRKLPKTIAGLVGEANSKFASGELNDAQAMCFEVIRTAPNFPQPFQTLAMIWEER